MFILSLQSGSNGNCIYVETSRARLLFDAGISGTQAERRLAAFGRDIRRVQALIISHDHSDHIRSAGIFHQRSHMVGRLPGCLAFVCHKRLRQSAGLDCQRSYRHQPRFGRYTGDDRGR